LYFKFLSISPTRAVDAVLGVARGLLSVDMAS